jgi:transposase-like protein
MVAFRRATRKQYGAEEKIRIVLEGLRGEDSIATLCRRKGIAESLYRRRRGGLKGDSLKRGDPANHNRPSPTVRTRDGQSTVAGLGNRAR